VIHGAERNAAAYFDYLMDAVPSVDTYTTLVITPWFQETGASDEAVWPTSSWRWGGVDGRKEVSSFGVLDQILERLRDRDRFPNLSRIVVTGHSAGGQFTQRYAGVASDTTVWTYPYVRFMPMNPSSYLYVDNRRLTSNGFQAVPQCPTGRGYNDYGYGLAARTNWSYVRDLSSAAIIGHYRYRYIDLFVGMNDNKQDDYLDVSCPAMYQGDNRYARAFIWHVYGTYEHGFARLTWNAISNAGHDPRPLWGSTAGRKALFGH
jgi:hypothetical protein